MKVNFVMFIAFLGYDEPYAVNERNGKWLEENYDEKANDGPFELWCFVFTINPRINMVNKNDQAREPVDDEDDVWVEDILELPQRPCNDHIWDQFSQFFWGF